MIDLTEAIDESTRVLVIALDEGKPEMQLQRPEIPDMDAGALVRAYMEHPDVLAVYLCFRVSGERP